MSMHMQVASLRTWPTIADVALTAAIPAEQADAIGQRTTRKGWLERL